jgi:hypothetical protein
MPTIDELRTALAVSDSTGEGLSPETVLRAGRLRRRRQRLVTALASTGVLAAVVAGTVAVTGMLPRSDEPQGLSFASQPWTVNDEGNFVIDGEMEAKVHDGTLCVAITQAWICAPPDAIAPERSWANDLLVVLTDEPIAAASVSVNGKSFPSTVFSFAAYPNVRVAATILDEGMHFNTGLRPQFTGLDDAGRPLVDVSLSR